METSRQPNSRAHRQARPFRRSRIPHDGMHQTFAPPIQGRASVSWEAPHWLEERPAAILPGYYRGARGTGAFPLASVLAG